MQTNAYIRIRLRYIHFPFHKFCFKGLNLLSFCWRHEWDLCESGAGSLGNAETLKAALGYREVR